MHWTERAPLPHKTIHTVTASTFRRYRPTLGAVTAARIAAGRLVRLYTRRTS